MRLQLHPVSEDTSDTQESAARRCVDEPDVLGTRARPPEEDKPGEIPMRIQPVLHKYSAECADPGADVANMEHFRFNTMLETDPNHAHGKNFYDWPTDSENAAFDGSARVLLGKALNVLTPICHAHMREAGEDESPVHEDLDVIRKSLRDAHKKADEGEYEPMSEIKLQIHCPMLRINSEIDDRDLGARVNNDDEEREEDQAQQQSAFSVDEQQTVRRGRYSWRKGESRYRLLNTQIKLTANDKTVTFKYEGSKPVLVIDGHEGSIPAPSKEMAALLDFSQYSETELARVRPDGYIPMKSMLTAAVTADDCTDRQIAALLTHLGPKLKHDAGSWFVWTDEDGWTKCDGDENVRQALRAAASNLEAKLKGLAHDDGIDAVYYRAIGQFHLRDGTGEEQGRRGTLVTPRSLALNCTFMPKTERGESSFLSRLKPWVAEPGFAKSFEECKDIKFKNGIQQMVPPFALRQPTPDDRAIVRIDCHLPPSPTTEEAKAAAKETALSFIIDLFGGDQDVALRELDKLACLLSGTCAVMTEANFRVMIGPFNEAAKRWATRCGKNTFIAFVKKLLGDTLSTSFNPSFLTMKMEEGRAYSFLKDVEWKLAHFIDEADTDRRWGGEPKRIWTGGDASDYEYRCEYKESSPHQLRTNALYAAANKFTIGPAPDIWSKLEPTPFPCVANIPENQEMIESGVPSFELDESKVNAIKTMSAETHGVILRYLMDRCHAILQDPGAAYPLTQKHIDAKAKLKQEAGGPGAEAEAMSPETAFDMLKEILFHTLMPCEASEAAQLNDERPIDAVRKRFQKSGRMAARCFCGSRPAKDACSFTVSAFAERLEAEEHEVYKLYVPREGRTIKLTESIQRALHLDVAPIGRFNECPRDVIFAWRLPASGEQDDDPSKSKSKRPADDSSNPSSSKKHKAVSEDESDGVPLEEVPYAAANMEIAPGGENPVASMDEALMVSESLMQPGGQQALEAGFANTGDNTAE